MYKRQVFKQLSERKTRLTAQIAAAETTLAGENGAYQINRLEREIGRHKKNLAKISAQLDGLKSDMSLVHIYFKELGIVKFSREELFSIIDLIGISPFST